LGAIVSQFRKNNRPTFIDFLWNIVGYIKYGCDRSVFFEYGSSLYRFWKNIDISKGVYFKRNSIVGCATHNSKLSIGENTTIGFSTIIISSGEIKIGSNCMIAPNVYIVDSNHGMSLDRPFNQQDNIVAEIVIEDNVWIGAHAVILPGVRIVSGSIIGANATVLKSITEQGVYVGSPARKVK